MNGRLTGKVAVVSGGSQNLGRAIVELFLHEGAKVVSFDRAAGSDDYGDKFTYVAGDVRRQTDWARARQAAVERFDRVDILVNNAGVSSTSQEGELSPEGWDAITSVNARGALLGCQEFLAHMVSAGGGSIVHVASTGGMRPVASGHVGYFASKAALLSLSKSIALRHGREGIRSNAVLPGLMERMVSSRFPSAGHDRSAVLDRMPLGRIGRHHEVAAGVAFLASDEASYITGAELVIDGGMTI